VAKSSAFFEWSKKHLSKRALAANAATPHSFRYSRFHLYSPIHFRLRKDTTKSFFLYQNLSVRRVADGKVSLSAWLNF
jgi:hypothetical protein